MRFYAFYASYAFPVILLGYADFLMILLGIGELCQPVVHEPVGGDIQPQGFRLADYVAGQCLDFRLASALEVTVH